MRIKAALEEKRCQFRPESKVQNGPQLEGDLQAVLKFACAVDDRRSVQVAARRLGGNYVVGWAAGLIMARAFAGPQLTLPIGLPAPPCVPAVKFGWLKKLKASRRNSRRRVHRLSTLCSARSRRSHNGDHGITRRFVADVSNGVANDGEGFRIVYVIGVRPTVATGASDDIRPPVGTGRPSRAGVPCAVKSVELAGFG